MAYQTGSASGCAAVLQALATFAAAHGWTVNNNASYSGGWWLAVHNGGGCYLNFVTPAAGTDDYITIYGATGFSVGAGPSGQAQTSAGFQFTAQAGPYSAYHFFSSSSGTYLHCLVEISSGMFAHFHGGQLNAVGGASPVIYVTTSRWYAYGPTYSGDLTSNSADYYYNIKPFSADGSAYSSGAVACTVDSTFRWFPMWSGTQPGRIAALGIGQSSSLLYGWQRSGFLATPNRYNGVAALFTIPFFLERAIGNTFSLVGEAPDVRYVNMTNNNAKDEITIGTDVWKLFPMVANVPNGTGTPNGPASSYPFGLAFKKSA